MQTRQRKPKTCDVEYVTLVDALASAVPSKANVRMRAARMPRAAPATQKIA